MVNIATFNGAHNLQKSRLLLYLYIVSNSEYPGAKTAQEIHEMVPALSMNYLYKRLLRLEGWEYIQKTSTTRGNRLVWGYEIAERGEKFLKERIPVSNFEALIAEFLPVFNDWGGFLQDLLNEKKMLFGSNGAEPEGVELEEYEPLELPAVEAVVFEDISNFSKWIVCPDVCAGMLYMLDWVVNSYQLIQGKEETKVPDSIWAKDMNEAHDLADSYRARTGLVK